MEIPDKYKQFVSEGHMTLDKNPIIQLVQLNVEDKGQYDDKPHAIYKKEDINRESPSPNIRYVFEMKERVEDMTPISKDELKDIKQELEYFKLSFISNFGSKELKKRLMDMDFKSFCKEMSIDPLIEMISDIYDKLILHN